MDKRMDNGNIPRGPGGGGAVRVYDFAMRANTLPQDQWATGLRKISEQATVVHAEPVAQFFIDYGRNAAPEDALRCVERCVPPFAVSMVEFRGRFEMEIGAVVWREIVDDGWKVSCCAWASDLQRSIALLPAFADVHVSPDGTPDWSRSGVVVDPIRVADEDLRRATSANLCEAFATALLTFRFMHARGVEVRDAAPPRADRRRAEKEGTPAPVTYKTLDIGVPTRALKTEGDVAANGIARAMHLCRGHFADYTKGAGLFGRHKVEVFVPEHVKGRRQKGVVVKDYAVGSERVNAGGIQ